ncbi:MAG: phasin family protein [Anaerolineae bacterium]|nr:phasin family protein [Anaerolineae bacterium]HNS38658.1 phasin family protein [Promineifilum sp.]
MKDEIEITEELESTESTATFLNGLRRVLLAAIGAVVLTQEQIEEFVGKLVERGEIADGDARNLLTDIFDRRKKIAQSGAKKAEEAADNRIENLLTRMNIPTKSEIDALSEKIEELSRKVDQLD